MTTAGGLALVTMAGLTAYAVLGGADFGAGLWVLSRNRDQRDLVQRAVGPVWEANHVWLIFVVITLFTGFPGAFGELSRCLSGPLSIALLGIVLRGAAFVFHQYGAPDRSLGAERAVRGTRLWGQVFAAASLVTPFAFGAAGAGLLQGNVRADGAAGMWRPFIGPLPLVGGLIAVACCAYLAAVYLSRDAERLGSDALVRRLRIRAMIAGTAAGGLALTGLTLLPSTVAAKLSGPGLPVVGVSAVAGIAALALLWRRRYRVARVAAAAAPAGLLAGWAYAMYPWAVPGSVPLLDSAAPPVIAGYTLAVLLAGLSVVLPSYLLLLRVLRVRSE